MHDMFMRELKLGAMRKVTSETSLSKIKFNTVKWNVRICYYNNYGIFRNRFNNIDVPLM